MNKPLETIMLSWDGVIADVLWTHEMITDLVLTHTLGLDPAISYKDLVIDTASHNLREIFVIIFDRCRDRGIAPKCTINDAILAWHRYHPAVIKHTPLIFGAKTALRLFNRFQPIVVTNQLPENLKLFRSGWLASLPAPRILTPTPGLRPKPFPDLILEAIKRFNLNLGKTVYIGASQDDYLAVKAAIQILGRNLDYIELETGWRGVPISAYDAMRVKGLKALWHRLI